MAMAALAVKICLRRKGKTNRPSKLERILLGYYIRLGPRSQESRVYLGTKRLRRGKQINRNFRIKSFYPKIRGHVFTPKFGKRAWELAGFQNYANQGVYRVKIDTCWIECDTGSILSE